MGKVKIEKSKWSKTRYYFNAMNLAAKIQLPERVELYDKVVSYKSGPWLIMVAVDRYGKTCIRKFTIIGDKWQKWIMIKD